MARRGSAMGQVSLKACPLAEMENARPGETEWAFQE